MWIKTGTMYRVPTQNPLKFYRNKCLSSYTHTYYDTWNAFNGQTIK